jgi:asparagine synthase (glutamine-hydrolysing)
LAAAMLPGRMRSAARARYHGTSGLAVVEAEAAAPTAASLRHALHHILTVTSLPSLLRYADRNSMAFSRESRLPFLDHRLVEFVFTLGSADLVAGGITKRILRRAMRGTVPDEVLDRTDKIGFATPEHEWMTGPARAWLEREIAEARRRGLLDPAAIDGEWRRLMAGGRNSATVWRIVNLELWYRKFIDRKERAA